MAPLPGWLFMIVGVAVMSYSKYIETKGSEINLIAFFWLGVGFLMWGIGREVIKRLYTKKPQQHKVGPPPKKEHDHDHRHPAGNKFHGQSHHKTHVHTQPQKHPSHPHKLANKNCPRCHGLNSGSAKFCNQCGHEF